MANVPAAGPPSAAAIAIGTAIISVVTGYYIGQARSIGLFGSTATPEPFPDDENDNDDDEDSDVSGEDGRAHLLPFSGNTEEGKLVLVVRTDLGMTKGKQQLQLPSHHKPQFSQQPSISLRRHISLQRQDGRHRAFHRLVCLHWDLPSPTPLAIAV